jgi:MscS family membrane protein
MFEALDYTGALDSLDINSIIISISIFIASIALAYIVRSLIARLAPLLVSRTKTTLDDQIVKALNGPLQLLIVVAGAYIAARTLSGLPDTVYSTADAVLVIVLYLVVAYIVSNVLGTVIDWYQKKLDAEAGSKLDTSIMIFFKRVITASIYIVAILMALSYLNVKITPLLASLGVAGVAVALAAQELLSSVFGTFAILTDRPFKVGDRIELSDGESGDVIDIGLRSTRIKTLDHKVVVIPNAEMAKSRINNYSEPDPMLRYTINIGISYDSDVEKASGILMDIVSGIEGALKDPAPVVYIDSLGDFSINLVMLVWGKNFRKDWDIPDKVYREALIRFKREGIVIPYPVRSVLLEGKKAAAPPILMDQMAVSILPHEKP